MRKFLTFNLLLAILFCTVDVFSQSATRNCGTMEYLEMLEGEDEHLHNSMRKIEEHTQDYLENSGDSRIDGVITIPVVVHVIYNTSIQNISEAQILSQIDVLNEDFRRTNSDADGTWSQAADSEIEFCLATVDPNGNPTNGITRTSTSTTSFSTNNAMKFTSSGGRDAWPTDQYLNMWVCNMSGGILGYAQFPGGSASTDGVVMLTTAFGRTGYVSSPFDLGRTCTHEVGHWLNLRHIWGDGGCSVDDFVSDTPTSDAPNYGCATGHVSCSSTDMVENYMDYSNDACMNLYTTGQVARMRALFEPGGFRASLLTSGGCGAPADPTCDDGIQNGDETGIDCGGSCATACPTCSDGVQNGNETGIDCGGSDCPACPCFGEDVNITIVLDNYGAETTWNLTDAGGAVLASGGPYSNGTNGQVASENVCLNDGCYAFNIFDSYGDGICCGYGNGSYNVTDASGASLASGGTFGSSATDNFCLTSSPAPTCSDGIQNGDETDVDCGGSDCPACPTCSDGIQNGDETDVDCGGSDCPACPTCSDGVQNGDETGVDCGGSDCPACSTCSDGIQNGDETDVDCGGSDCPACSTCSDGVQNGDETGVDCGGSDCPACSTCSDGVQNGDETGVDCGGSDCPTCSTCSDGVQNGDETGVDCGGSDCPACPCLGEDVNITIVLDNYGAETTWNLTDAGGAVLVSGGPYSNGTNGQVVSENVCLTGDCYTFNIFDSYGDGICCGYGNGSYSVTDASGASLASGGTFGSSATDNFCLTSGPAPTCSDGVQNGDETDVDCGGSDCPACPTCSDGVQNGDETDVDCGGSDCPACPTCSDGVQNGDETDVDCGGSDCPACPTCSDGVQNGDETGIDCGGSCAPCGGGSCTYELINFNNFDSGWGIWNDGGSDCRRSWRDAAYANSGDRCVRLRDNTSTSTTTTDVLDLASYEELTVDFTYVARSMDNSNEDFWLQISTNGGSTYTTVEEWNRNDEFVNGPRYFDTVVIPGPFTSNTRLRFRCDASGNSDWIYIDDVTITGCLGALRISEGDITDTAIDVEGTDDAKNSIIFTLYPNPAQEFVNVKYTSTTITPVTLNIYDITGRLVVSQQFAASTNSNQISVNTQDLGKGYYVVELSNGNSRSVEKLIIH